MSDDLVIGRVPARLRGGNGVTVIFDNGVATIGIDLDTLMVTPTDAGAPVLLADLLAMFLAGYSGARNIINISDGFYDVPGSGNPYSVNDGYF